MILNTTLPRTGLPRLIFVFLIFSSAAITASAQQTTGVPCSPSATISPESKYLPPAPPPFGGEINLKASDSKPCWPPRVVAPKGAPNDC